MNVLFLISPAIADKTAQKYTSKGKSRVLKKQSMEKIVQNYLYYNDLDPALFPELETDAGVYKVELKIFNSKADKRIVTPKSSRELLLVSSTVLAKNLPDNSKFELEIQSGQVIDKSNQLKFVLIEPPSKHDNQQRIEQNKAKPIPEGTVFRALFWVDLEPLKLDKKLRPGDVITFRYGPNSSSIVLPSVSAP